MNERQNLNMAPSNFKAKLAAAKKNWKKAKKRAETESGFEEIADGRYVARCLGGEIKESQSSGRLQIQYRWEIQDGEYEGKTVNDFDGLETEDNLVWVARKLSRLGYEVPEDFDDVEEILVQLAKDKPTARIRLRTRGDFQNLMIDKLIDGDEDEDESDSDEDVPEEADEADDEDTDSDEAEDSDDSEDDEATADVGSRVRFKYRKKEYDGTIEALDEDEGTVDVTIDSTGKTVTVSNDDIVELLTEEDSASDDDEEEESDDEDDDSDDDSDDDEDEVPEKPARSPRRAVKKTPPPARGKAVSKKPAPKKGGRR